MDVFLRGTTGNWMLLMSSKCVVSTWSSMALDARLYTLLVMILTYVLCFFSRFYPLRPELVESTYLLYRATKNPFYLHVGRDILYSLNNHTRAK